MFNPRHHGQKGTKRTALQALAETVGAEPRAREMGGSDTQRVMQAVTHVDQRVSRQAIPGMLSGTPTSCRSRVIAPVPVWCVALPYFRFEAADRVAQRSTAGFDSVDGLPQKEDALVAR